VLPLVERLVLAKMPSGAAILDLCCGTGQLAAALTKRGFRVTGVDGSEEMLGYARHNAPGAEFHLADARSFVLGDRFDAAISTYDSLNHLMTIDDLTKAFVQTARVLKPGAPFLFDLNMDTGYRERWCGSFSVVEPDHVVAVRSSYDAEQRCGRFDLTLFHLVDQAWKRLDLALEQRAYSEEEIRAALASAGFGPCRMFDPSGAEVTAECHRTFFLVGR
jgi:ubiquinone/menaquinone biosynthesis C-methylase UbiE